MAELLLRVHDKVNTEDFYANCKCTKRGDVIVAMPDGWNWGAKELTLPFYRVLKIPALSVGEAETLIAPELEIDPVNPSLTLQRRAFGLDIDRPGLPAEMVAYLADDTRIAATFTVTLPLAQIRVLKTVKARIPDPAIL